ncbi:MAG: hypothetical protein MZV70_01835 [Desulfobacterales bacterium]|nr:hypothetical protein [Desulfobacterales bacterium]
MRAPRAAMPCPAPGGDGAEARRNRISLRRFRGTEAGGAPLCTRTAQDALRLFFHLCRGSRSGTAAYGFPTSVPGRRARAARRTPMIARLREKNIFPKLPEAPA